MVGVNFYIHRIGTVAIFATLFVAIYVNGARACELDFGHISDFDSECNDVKGTWAVNEDVKDSADRKILSLAPEQDGCLKTKESVVLNATSKVTFRFYRDAAKDEPAKIILRLVPKEGACPDEECLWEVSSDSRYKPGEWVTAEYKYPLKAVKEYYVQLQVEKSKGKFLLDQISVQTAEDNSNCHLRANNDVINLPKELTGTGGNKSTAPGFMEISKNLMLTSASVLTLNNLLN